MYAAPETSTAPKPIPWITTWIQVQCHWNYWYVCIFLGLGVVIISDCLQGLTQVEEMLISAVMPIMSIYKLPHGQYGYSGHVVNLPQDVASFAQCLPRLPSKLDVIVRREGTNHTHSDFRVRREVVQRALQWLVTHNKYYHSLGITTNTTALAQLPEDGTVSTLVSVTEDCCTPDTVSSASDTPATSEVQDDHISHSFVPIAVPSMTEQEAVQQAVAQHHSASHTPLMWPSIGGMPLNEFTTEGYFSCAFPTLFPTGAADFLGERQVPVTIGNNFKHLMQYNDGRFARHPRFRFFALNTEMRHRALQTGRVYVRQHPGDGQMSIDELRDMVGDKERLSQVEYSTTPQVYVVPSSTGNVSEVVCSPWWTHWVCPLSSSHTVLQTSNGQNWHDSSAQTTLTPGLPEPIQSLRTQLLLTGSSTTGSWSLSRSSTLEYLEQLTTG